MFSNRLEKMKRLSIILLLLSAALTLSAQNSADYIKKMNREGFDLFFIEPVTLKGDGAFEMDFTFTHSDSIPKEVTLRFSVISRVASGNLDSLVFEQDGKPIATIRDFKRMYLEKKSKKWVARYEVQIPYDVLRIILSTGDDLVIKTYDGSGALIFDKSKKWGKAASIVEVILDAEI